MRITEVFEDTYQLIAYELRASLFRYTLTNTDINQPGKDLTHAYQLQQVRKMTAYQLRTLLCWASSLAIREKASLGVHFP